MNNIDKIRYILNILFLAGAAATFVIYFVAGAGSLFFYTGLAAISCKMIEFILRFML